ncbi:hypothetical protein ALMP_82380 [Streptomyces sp. A012304]|nr:hypothetical protein ALMP_82380 [Streptomyces sp. A012304]
MDRAADGRLLEGVGELDLAAPAGQVRSKTSKTAGSRTWRPIMAYRLGASARAGFSTRPVTRTTPPPRFQTAQQAVQEHRRSRSGAPAASYAVTAASRSGSVRRSA